MKIFSEPTDWKDLQNKVCLLLQQSGFTAETEKKVATPRGEVELDVFVEVELLVVVDEVFVVFVVLVLEVVVDVAFLSS